MLSGVRSRAALSRHVRSFASTSVTLKTSTTKVHLVDAPPSELKIEKAELIKYYTEMTRIRRMEVACDNLYKQRKIRGFCHLYTGQEAVAVGMEGALKWEDHVITAYRCHANQLLRGDTIAAIIAELMGKKSGSVKGKGGSMHLYYPENRFYGGNGIVGAQVPLGAGIALAAQYKGDNSVVAAMYGDGAANQGQIFEAANMAALWKLPLIFVCENNKYGMGTAAYRAAALDEFYLRGNYVAGIQCDGMDVVSVRAAMEHAAEHCRSGKGPIFVEMMTYRYMGHSMSDPGISYRAKDEIQDMRSHRDPIANTKKRLLDLKWATEDDLKTIDKEARKEVKLAVDAAEADTELDPPEAFSDIYAGGREGFIRATDYPQSIVRAVN